MAISIKQSIRQGFFYGCFCTLLCYIGNSDNKLFFVERKKEKEKKDEFDVTCFSLLAG